MRISCRFSSPRPRLSPNCSRRPRDAPSGRSHVLLRVDAPRQRKHTDFACSSMYFLSRKRVSMRPRASQSDAGTAKYRLRRRPVRAGRPIDPVMISAKQRCELIERIILDLAAKLEAAMSVNYRAREPSPAASAGKASPRIRRLPRSLHCTSGFAGKISIPCGSPRQHPQAKWRGHAPSLLFVCSRRVEHHSPR